MLQYAAVMRGGSAEDFVQMIFLFSWGSTGSHWPSNNVAARRLARRVARGGEWSGLDGYSVANINRAVVD